MLLFSQVHHWPGHQEFQEWRKRRFIKVGFIFNPACRIIIDSALHYHQGLVKWNLHWIASRLRSTFDLCNPVFLLHCFIIQRRSLFLHFLIFFLVLEHPWAEIEVFIVLGTWKIEILSRVPVRNLVSYNFATFLNQMSQV